MTPRAPETLDLQISERAAALRREFDQTFAGKPHLEPATPESFLRIKVDARSYALRLAEISGLVADRRIVPLPSPIPAFLGVAGVRGGLLPVFSLGGLLGHPPGEAPRWLALAGGPGTVGLAFDDLEGYVRIPRESLAMPDPAQKSSPHVRELARSGDGVLPVLSVLSLVEAVKGQTQ